MVLQNFVQQVEGVARVIHFVDHEIQPRRIRDSITGRPKVVNVLVFRVDQLDGVAVSTEYSFTSERAASNFASFLPDKSYRNYLWTIVPRGGSFQREYEMTRTPLSPADMEAIEEARVALEGE